MKVAAAIPWPATSPITKPMQLSSSSITSYQSPPTADSSAAGRYRAAIRRPGDLGQLAGQQAALEGRRDLTLHHQPRALDRERDSVGHELKQLDVALMELALGERADVQNPDHLALDDEWDAEQRADPLLAEERIDGLDRRRPGPRSPPAPG